ncbi:MAG: ATP-binding protein [Gammaproteobacteria bacterium]|nr:ATP-binding protein [Gammaproteobacteria bacterium]
MDEQALLEMLLGEFYYKLQCVSIIHRDAVFPVADNKIKVAIGMRRAGKTSFLLQTIQSLLTKNISITQILYINFEDDRLMPLTREKCAKLIEAFYALYPENHDRHCYFFLDEIQMAPDWAVIIRRFHDSKNATIYLSGSSAKLLSKEIHTSLRGRSLSTEIWPMSFKEYLLAKKTNFQTNLFSQKKQDQLKKYFEAYLIGGGFPEVVDFDSDVRIKTLQEYIDVVIYRDIIERHGVKSTALLKYLILFVIQNSGASFSINKFYNDVKSQGYQISKDVLYDYMHYIEDAYLAFSVALYDRSLRKVQTNPKKIYAIDPGLINAVILNKQYDFGRLFETVVYLDLRRQGCKVSYYITRERFEVDFLAQTVDGRQKLIQVCWDVSDEETLARETRALKAAEKELKIEGEIITLNSYLKKGVYF